MHDRTGYRIGKVITSVTLLVLLAVFTVACGRAEITADSSKVDRGDLVNPASEGEEEVLESMIEVNPPLGTSNNRLVGSDQMSTDEFVQAVGANVNALWQAVFEQSGFSYSNASLVLYDEPIPATGCDAAGVADPQMGPFYCPQNQTIYYPLSWQDPSSGETPAEIGDFAVAVIVAHEGGHHIQNLLDISSDPNALSIQLELQADCFAGIWSRSVFEQGVLEPGDIGEAVHVAANAADMPGTPPESAGAHGTEAQRTNAFFTGYESGDVNQCSF